MWVYQVEFQEAADGTMVQNSRLEYSVSSDKVFCFPCRKFPKDSKREVVFTVSGFNNWKAALEAKKGFYKHCSSITHIITSQWEEQKTVRTRKRHSYCVGARADNEK